MRAKLVIYSTEKLTPTERSILSKKINGYLDKSNRARYTYKREGIITNIPHIKVSNKTFIIKTKDFVVINKEITRYGATVKSWDIDIKKF